MLQENYTISGRQLACQRGYPGVTRQSHALSQMMGPTNIGSGDEATLRGPSLRNPGGLRFTMGFRRVGIPRNDGVDDPSHLADIRQTAAIADYGLQALEQGRPET